MLFYFITVAGISSLLLEQTLFGLAFQLEGQLSEAFTFTLIFFPLLSLSSFLTYRKYKRTYIEHLVSTIYIASAFGILLLIFENIFSYLSISNRQNLNWIIVLISVISIWDSILFSSPSKPLKIALNAILGMLVLTSFGMRR